MVLIHQLMSPLPGKMNCYCQRELQKKFLKYSKPFHNSQLSNRGTFYRRPELASSETDSNYFTDSQNFTILLFHSVVGLFDILKSLSQISAAVYINSQSPCSRETWDYSSSVKSQHSDKGKGRKRLSNCFGSAQIIPEAAVKPWTVIQTFCKGKTIIWSTDKVTNMPTLN